MIDADLLRRFFHPVLLRDRAMDLTRVLAARVPGRCTPLLVQFLVTLRCNLRCAYCENPEPGGEELSHEQVMDMLAELADAGMRKIAFGGGEPLLRKELGEWIRYAHSRRAYTNVVTNGILLPRRIDAVAEADLVVVSIDGPEEANDAVRGEGSYRRAVDGLRACRERGIKTMISAVLSSATVDHLEHILDLARELDTTAIFQPVDPGYDLVRESVAATLPDEERLRVTIAVSKLLLHRAREGFYRLTRPSRAVGSRHGQWSAVSLYCLGRYFQKDYPNPIWAQCVRGAQLHFRSLHEYAWVSGESDNLFWYNTGIAPIFTYLALSGERKPVENGVLRGLLQGQEMLVSGREGDWALRSSRTGRSTAPRWASCTRPRICFRTDATSTTGT